MFRMCVISLLVLDRCTRTSRVEEPNGAKRIVAPTGCGELSHTRRKRIGTLQDTSNVIISLIIKLLPSENDFSVRASFSWN